MALEDKYSYEEGSDGADSDAKWQVSRRAVSILFMLTGSSLPLSTIGKSELSPVGITGYGLFSPCFQNPHYYFNLHLSCKLNCLKIQ